MNKEKFEKDMAAFSWKQHQEFVGYFKHLTQMGWTLNDSDKFVALELKQKRDEVAGQKEERINQQRFMKKCPDCGTPMQLFPVNTCPGCMTGDDSQSVWLCTNKVCMSAVYNTKSVGEIIKQQNKRGKCNG